MDIHVNSCFFLGKPYEIQWIALWATCGEMEPVWGQPDPLDGLECHRDGIENRIARQGVDFLVVGQDV